MATYAAVVSLIHVLEHVMHPARQSILLDKNQIESLHKNICFFQDFLEDFSQRRSKIETEGLESEMEIASYAAEDIIESFVLDQILAPSPVQAEKSLTRFSQEIQEVIEYMDLIKEKVMEIKQKMGVEKDQQHVNSLPAAGLSRLAPSSKDTMVGFDDYLIQIMERLTGQESTLQMIPIVGMGGIGKTTLARNVYDSPLITQYFHIRAWVTVSQEYTVREILLALLHDVEFFLIRKEQQSNENLDAFTDKMSKKNDEQLGEQLHKSLFGRRYLIVMDDIWGTEAWDNIRMFFPENYNESRIMITTRLSDVADCFGSSHKMDFLDHDKSWNLFCEKVFPQDDCPLEFEEIGKEIAINCRGLPLAIVVIGGLLAKSDRTLEYWEYVADNLNSIINSRNDEHCFNVLSLSYSHLPIHLKPCFLYMGTFPEDCEITVSRLIKLWIAEGFLKPIRDKSLEDIAEEYLMDLTDRNLILVGKQGTTGKMKSCTIHDLSRDVCLREAQKENFMCATSVSSPDISPNMASMRRLSVHQSIWGSRYPHPRVLDPLRSASCARSLVSDVRWISSALKYVSSLRLLRVLDVVEKHSPEEIEQLINSRYLAFNNNAWRFNSRLTSSISLLWNLQTLIGRSNGWAYPTFYHLKFGRCRNLGISSSMTWFCLILLSPKLQGNILIIWKTYRHYSLSETLGVQRRCSKELQI